MTYYLGKVGRAGARLVSSCKDLYYDVNAAYLTGAVDIIVVKQEDGSLKSSPFHVRFGKLGVLRTGDWKEVEVEVNGSSVDLQMKIDESGKAFFVQPKTSEGNDVEARFLTDTTKQETEHIAIVLDPMTTGDPTQSNTQESHDNHVTKTDQSDHQEEATVGESSIGRRFADTGVGTTGGSLTVILEREPSEPAIESGHHSDGDERVVTMSLPARSSPIAIQRPDTCSVHECHEVCCSLPSELELGVLSDSAVESDRVPGPQLTYSALSDTEVEVQDRLSSKLWEWSASNRRGQQHTSSKAEASSSVTTSTSDVHFKRRHSEQAPGDRSSIWSALTGILKRRHRRRYSSVEDGIYLDEIDDDMDPEEVSKFFPSSSTGDPSMSVWDHAGSSGLGSSPSLSPSQSHSDLQKEDMQKLVSTLDDLAFSLCGGLSQGNISEEAFQSSLVSFEDFCTDPNTLFTNPNLVIRVAGKYYNWQVAAPLILSSVVYLQTLPKSVVNKLEKKHMPKKKGPSFWYFWGRKDISEDPINGKVQPKSEGATPVGSPRKWMSERVRGVEVLSSDEDPDPPPVALSRPRQRSLRKKKYNLTTHLSSEQLAKLPLKSGANEVVFSITTKFQGTTKAQCTLYFWNYSDKIVVSDIDGTITRSDVAGHFLPLFGKDWTQNGVVELFNAIENNGYQIVYLTARAIGQSWYTKEFLRKVRRGSAKLPDGPLFLAPFSLYIAFRKEVIERCPEEFKIQCLKQIKSLFPEERNPFHAAFGNKTSDAKSYMEAEIPRCRIFTVNPKGHLKYELSWTFQSSYTDLMGFIDAQFPPLDMVDSPWPVEQRKAKEEYSTFNYWREPILACDIPLVMN